MKNLNNFINLLLITVRIDRIKFNILDFTLGYSPKPGFTFVADQPTEILHNINYFSKHVPNAS